MLHEYLKYLEQFKYIVMTFSLKKCTVLPYLGISGVTTVPLVIINEFFKQVIQTSHLLWKSSTVIESLPLPSPPTFLADQKQSEIQILNTILDNRIP